MIREAIVIKWEFGAAHEAQKRHIPPNELPELIRASDIVWLDWMDKAGENTDGLRLVVILDLANAGTVSAVARIEQRTTLRSFCA